jgi:YebC/PmpR family DNA-binding regulatory protein
MSKHSKWSKVKHQKGGVDAKRAAVFTKMARLITVAARDGGGDPNFNFKLRTAVDRALEENMPKDNIDRAIKKGTGELASERIEEATYEGYAPGGLPVIVEALTDNRNRTSGNLKFVFSDNGGSFAATGAVQWMFERKGVVRLKTGKITEEQELGLIDAGADDMAVEDGDEENPAETAARTVPENLAHLREAAEKLGLVVDEAVLEWLPKEKAEAVAPEVMEKAAELFAALEDDEDVSGVFTNI